MTSQAIDVLLRAASRAGASVLLSPSRVAVFGGALSTEAAATAGLPPLSQRDAFIRWVKTHRKDLSQELLVPEVYDDWSEFNTYSDLLRFEEDLGYVTSVVVIFLEAPGSIAELGAFSQIATLNQQLVLVVFEKHHPKKSFISLGPLRQLESEGRSSVCVVPERPIAEFAEDIDVILKPIDEKIKAAKVGRAVRGDDRQHQVILALDTITLLEVATFSEVKAALGHFSDPVADARVRQILYTLSKANLAASRRYGGIDYYYPISRGVSWVNYSGPDASKPFNRLRIAAKLAASRAGSRSVTNAHALIFGAGSK